MKILLLQDNRTLAAFIKNTLEKHGFSVSCALNDSEGKNSALSGLYDIIILDESLTENDRRLVADIRKAHGQTSIIVSGTQNSVDERVAWLNLGADYCIPSPPDIREIISCINAILRRNNSGDNELYIGNTGLKLSSCQLVCGDKSVRLSSKEFDVMRILLYSKNTVLPKEVILAKVWSVNSDATDNHVEVYVGFLRKKLESIGSNVAIRSVRRLGYFLEVTE